MPTDEGGGVEGKEEECAQVEERCQDEADHLLAAGQGVDLELGDVEALIEGILEQRQHRPDEVEQGDDPEEELRRGGASEVGVASGGEKGQATGQWNQEEQAKDEADDALPTAGVAAESEL